MKRKIISALLVLILCLALPFGASADGEQLVFDEADLLTASGNGNSGRGPVVLRGY